jgi:tetratricopeptide (TPR) repeat protein
MNIKQKFRSFWCVCISLFWLNSAQAQESRQTFDLAHRLFETGDYKGAIRHYQRVLFFEPALLTRPAYMEMGQCFLALENTEMAGFCYDQAFFASNTDEQKLEAVLKKVDLLSNIGQFDAALVELYNLSDSLPKPLQERKTFQLAMVHLGRKDWVQAQEQLLLLTAQHPTWKPIIEKTFRDIKRYHRISPKTARIMSMIVPGLGQFYAGDLKNGFNSFILAGGLAVLFFSSLGQFTLADALMAIAPWFQRYYMGGYMRAETIAESQIQKRTNRAITSMLRAFAASQP